MTERVITKTKRAMSVKALAPSVETALSALRQAKMELLMDLSLRINKAAEEADKEKRWALMLVLDEILEMVKEHTGPGYPELDA